MFRILAFAKPPWPREMNYIQSMPEHHTGSRCVIKTWIKFEVTKVANDLRLGR